MLDAAVWLDEAEKSRKVKFPCGVLITNEGVRLQFSLAARAVGQPTAAAGHVPSAHNTLLSQVGSWLNGVSNMTCSPCHWSIAGQSAHSTGSPVSGIHLPPLTSSPIAI